MEFIQPEIEIKDLGEKGMGIFALRDFNVGELIEHCPVIPINKKDTNLLQKTVFDHYMYPFRSTRSYCLVLGYGSLYNHSFDANADWEQDVSNKAFIYKAHKKIKKGDEIFVNYNGNPNDETPIKWFNVI